MSEKSLKRKAVEGVLWRIGDTGAGQFIQFIVSVILARLILLDQFGMLAMVMVFMAISGVFIDSGFTQALIRKTDRTQIDCSTVYWFNVIVSCICYAIIYICAPLVSRFYEMPQLTVILRVIATTIVIGSFTGVHRTLLTAEMDFKALTKFNLIAAICSAAVGITMAYYDFQVWALIGQSLTSSVLNTVFIWYKVKWRPSLAISLVSLKEFFSFGSKLLGSSILDTLYGNMYSITIGKVYKASDLAFYNRAQNLLNLVTATPTSILQSVTYPTLCKLQHDDDALKSGYRRTLRLASFIIFPLSLGMGAVAYPLIKVVYTKVWIFSASLLSIIAFGKMWFPIHAINLNYLIVKGRSDLFFRLEVIKKIQGVLVLCITIPLGLKAMCYGSVVSSCLSLIWNTHYTGKFLGMTILKQLRDFSHILLLCGVMYAGARTTAHFMGNDILSLVCSVGVGAAIYIGGALLFRFPEVKELKELRK